jgi:hypothetical protein
MKNKTYYIYHIPNVKIGVSTQPKKRTKVQGYADYKIIEQHQCIYKVSDREIELQKQYGYKVDVLAYWKTLNNNTFEGRSKGGKTSGNLAKESGQLSKIHSLGGKIPSYDKRKLNYEIAQYIRTQYARKVDVFGKRITMCRLSKVFAVTVTVIARILNNKTYTQA